MAVCDVHFNIGDEFLQLKIMSLFTLYYLHYRPLRGPRPIAIGSVKVQIVYVFFSCFS